MTVPVSDLRTASPAQAPRRHRRWPWAVVGAVAALIAGFALFVGTNLGNNGGSIPSFPSLAAHPDSSLHGTVAYYASDTGCIRLVAAAGRPSKTLWCLPQEDSSTWPTVGKPAGPQLVWRSDGRLEVTMFRFTPGPGKGQSLSAGWQRVIDVGTGKVENVAAAQVPSAPTTTAEASVSPEGARVGYTLDGSNGRAKVTLTDRTGTRTLLSVHGPGTYTYRFGPVFWAPNWRWIAASDDGRILVITPGTPSVTRVLVTGSGGGAGGGTAGPAFAVSARDFLTNRNTVVRDVLRRALDTGNFSTLSPYVASTVDYAIAASGSFGTTSGTDALHRLATYLSGAHGRWNLAISAATLRAYKNGPYARFLNNDTYFAVSPEKLFVSVHINSSGKIDQLFMAAHTGLLR